MQPLLSLQVLRAIAALLLLVHHAGYDADTIAARRGIAALSLDAAFDWTFGIHLFFVISGYIMLRSARGFGSVRSAAVFLARRMIRVAPLYWLLTTLVLLGAWCAPGLLNIPLGGMDVIVESYFFYPVMRQGELRPVLGQGWTLDYEMVFYALFGLSLLFPRRIGLAALAAALVGLVLLGRLIVPPFPAFGVWTDGLLLEFLMGLGLGIAQNGGLRLGRWGAISLAMAGCAVIVAMAPLDGVIMVAPTWLTRGLPATAIVAAAVLGPVWPRWRLVVGAAVLGDASYSLYLSHPFAIRLLREAWLVAVPTAVPTTVYLGLAGTTAIATALFLYRFVERPMTIGLQARLLSPLSLRRPILPDAASSPDRMVDQRRVIPH